jgi:hypothetical protein
MFLPSLSFKKSAAVVLRLVARYADACNIPTLVGKDDLQHKLDVLRDHCQSLGRPYEEIEKTTLDQFAITRDGRNNTLPPDATVDQLAAMAEIGIDQVILILRNITDLEAFDVMATQVIPEVEKARVTGRP